VSSWLGPPHMNKKMHDCARPKPWAMLLGDGTVAPDADRAESSVSKPIPSVPRHPACRMRRRPTPRDWRKSAQPWAWSAFDGGGVDMAEGWVRAGRLAMFDGPAGRQRIQAR
jgi:hypothetical protein